MAYLLAQTHPDVQVVLYADTADWAFQAFRSQCAGYLLLPFDPLALQAQVNRLRYVFDLQQTKREAANRSLLIKTRIGYQLTPVSDILFVERSNRKNRIVTQSGAEIHPLGYTMNQLEQMLEGAAFTGVTSPLSSTCPRFPSSGRTAAAKPTPSSLTAMTARSCSAATNTPNCSPC